ncbi:glucose-inhibited division protein A [Picosynechococcus sp. PCC 7003]|uniref:hypothetical protein n=1 Tax=Cyanophyceae TaxID=3028117 RepID=UPI00081064E5|nr:MULTISPECIES: hypothetical protein [Cyanophyceae]ANV83869.1 glucose-inhibited division protein A [Picosynechococcus sp. PCC 7003]
MQRGKLTAIITGAISLLLAIAYLLLVQILDFRGEMKPAPMVEMLPTMISVLEQPCTNQKFYS